MLQREKQGHSEFQESGVGNGDENILSGPHQAGLEIISI